MTTWNFGDVLDHLEARLPHDDPALISGARTITWGEARSLSNNLAHALATSGGSPGDKIAFYLRNCPEYIVGVSGALKSRLVHVNVNHRYTADELFYILDNSDARFVVYSAEFRATVDTIRHRLPEVLLWIEVGGAADVPAWAIAFAALSEPGDGAPLAIERSGDDQFFIYTGGTTGMPKGVIWTQHDLFTLILGTSPVLPRPPADLADFCDLAAVVRSDSTVLPAPPLIHATGLLGSLIAYLCGGCVVMLEHASFDPAEMLRAIGAHRVKRLYLVGDSFGRPLVSALAADPDGYDVSSVTAISSSGVMWTLENKRDLLRYMPDALLSDGFSSSEAIGMGSSLMTRQGEVGTAQFALGPRCRVIDEEDRDVVPGSGKSGRIAIGPPNPIGYYKDAAASAKTFRTLDGVRYSIPGDWCVPHVDGTLELLGRGSSCINTAGEKVFPEEVEEAIKTHPSVDDALVFGVADEQWGQVVTAVVRLRAGGTDDADTLRAHARRSLAGYKVPKRIVMTDRSLRANNGKADYAVARAVVEAASAAVV